MDVRVVDELGAAVGPLWREAQAERVANGRFAVAAPLSSTPLPVYQWVLGQAHTFDSWASVDFVLMDEQVDGAPPRATYIAPDDPASYEGFARRHFLGPLAERIGVAVPVTKPQVSELDTFDTRLDLLVLAVGVRGNYANVMPGTEPEAGWHLARLLPEFNQAHTGTGGAYAGAGFREYGMSLGPRQVRDAGAVVVIASGAHKRELTRQLLATGEVDPEFPLSVIHHPDVRDRVTVLCTHDAAP